MILQRLFRFSSIIQSAVSVHLRRNIGVTAVAFNKELDPVQKIFVDKIREYRTKRQSSGGPVDTGPEYQQDLERELFKLKQMYGKADMNTFPDFKFEEFFFLLFFCTHLRGWQASRDEMVISGS
uniref:ATP synthase peripheral stalk subunit F6, mitochondrial n=1 Tax=Rhinolophus ferrumequinum TaxID=59479 RepID=A0A671EJL4_RHIFE